MKNILVPIDHSAATGHVVDVAQEIARPFGARVHLVHVKELTAAPAAGGVGYGVLGMPDLISTSGLAVPVVESIPERAAPEEERNLKKWHEELVRRGLDAVLHEPTGDIVDEILKKAHLVEADLIVMGRHGHGAMYNLLVGSVTEGVLKRAVRPVLLVPSFRS